ncbi:MAG: FtsX-like permease family protein [Gracilimonas sp.]|nr:FtsX-like permease family protein [Gracilimonas sp.]
MSEFDINEAIQEWRRELRKEQGLEPGYIEELECNLLDRYEEYVEEGLSEKKAFEKASEKSISDPEKVADEFFKARTPIRAKTPPWKGKAKWVELLPSYLKVAVRNFQRKGSYTIINFIGLTVGLLTACFVGLYINYELSWDEFHSQSDRIVRIGQEYRSQKYSTVGFESYYSTTREVQLAQIQAFENVPGVEQVAHFWISGGPSFLEIEDRRYSQDGLLTTNTPSAFFNLFDWKFLHGSAESFSASVDRVVLTQSTAQKILSPDEGSISALIGQSFLMDSVNYEIAGIIEDIPDNSHYEFNVAMHDAKIEYWGARTYALLEKTADIDEVSERWNENISIINPRLGEDNELFKGFVVRPLESLHLYADDLYENKTPGNPRYLWIFGIIGVVILLITLTNYTNLSIAMYAGRNREIGMRKVLGAGKWQVAGQFLVESILLALLTVPFVLVFLNWLLPYFNEFMDVHIQNEFLQAIPYLLMLILSAALFGLMSGLYPSIMLSKQKIRALFEKQMTRPASRGFTLRKGLITFQFVLLIGLGSVTWFINSQLIYISQKDIGYAKDGIVYVLMENNQKYAEFTERLSTVAGVLEVGSGTPLARNTFNQVTYRIDGDEEIYDDGYSIFMNPGALKAYGIETTVDEYFEDPDNTPEELHLINDSGAEQFAQVLGIEKHELIGKTFRTEPSYIQDNGTVGFPKQIDGFFEDINMFSLREEIDPYFMEVRPDVTTSWAIVNFNTANISKVMDDIESTYEELGQSFPFITRFQSDRIESLYKKDKQAGALTIYLSFLAFLVAILGLIGLAAYLTTLREKEIGVRKVLGTSTWQILFQLNKEYIYLVAISMLIAGPIAYFGVMKWLSNYAYRIDINPLVFVLVALLTLIIASIAVSSQTLKAAHQNPVQSLRNEQ